MKECDKLTRLSPRYSVRLRPGSKKAISPIFDLLNNRDKASLDIFSLRDESLDGSDSLPDTDVLAQEIVVHRLASLRTTQSQGSRPGREPRRRIEDLEAALEQFCEIANDLGADGTENSNKLEDR
jgi:type I restriction enzyme M protein